ncbi:hypothetical protein [Streptomyces scabiei]|uniref:hypothetical protein n=1 Tax=Streptomyces scabiei TaxID=1930 RepID=UPI000765CC4E|nr:hypothetical protein [Streptomyces scabiei]
MAAIVWLRLSDDRLVRADRVVAVDLRVPLTDDAGRQEPVAREQGAWIVAQLTGPDASWVQVAACPAVRGGELVVGLLGALAAASAHASGVRFVYGLRYGGELSRWTYGPVIPLADPRVVPLHEVQDPAPGRWLAASSREGR